jgi:hypothetical protein
MSVMSSVHQTSGTLGDAASWWRASAVSETPRQSVPPAARAAAERTEPDRIRVARGRGARLPVPPRGRAALRRLTRDTRGVDVREVKQRDGSTPLTFTVRWREADGSKPRRTFDTLRAALDSRSKRQSAMRWRPEELRQERAGRVTLSVFFESWWMDHAMVELKRAPRLGALLCLGVGPTSVVKTMSMLQRVFRDAVESGEVPFKHRRRARAAEELQAVQEAQSDGGSGCASPRGSGRLETDGCVAVGPGACRESGTSARIRSTTGGTAGASTSNVRSAARGRASAERR